jgi:catechol 2,3-dioxygenase-like lactoylglutathione lyase family enzyme
MPDEGLRIACFEAANITIEFIQYTEDGPSRAKSVMGEQPGLNHLSAQVTDIDASIVQLEAAGFEVMDGFPRDGVHGPVAFFEPDEATGLLFEICQR